MNGLEFTASIVESLAWPVASIFLVLLLKDEIVKLAPFIKRLKAGPLEAEFERDVRELKESELAPQDAASSRIVDTASKTFLFQLAELHPRSAVLETWVRLEAAARAALLQDKTKGPMASYVSAARLAESLVKAGVIDQSEVTLYHELRRLRNDVAHLIGLEPTQEAVRSYIELASPLQSRLEGKAR
ncbi:MAG: hypothetical protein IPH99_09320 [Xanthomonadales bacterium]|nr:hypothetical protein [Xanthomonadales bacterium]